MPKFTRPEALNKMGVSIEQLTAYEKELKKFLDSKKAKTGNNGNDPEKKTKSKKKKET